VLVAEGVEDLEYYVTFMRLQERRGRGYWRRSGVEAYSWQERAWSTPSVKIETLRADDLFALVLPGGWAPDKLRRYSIVTDLVREMDKQSKIIGIICHGALVAISAGILRGRKSTGSLGIKDDLLNAGASWVDEPAFREGHLVWGRVGADIPAFCRELVAALISRSGEKNE